jgi:hypothetical protein
VSYRKIIVLALLIIGITSAFSSFVLYDHLLHVSPTAPAPLANQLYQLSEHGYEFYVTGVQYWLFHALLYGGFTLGVVGATLNNRWKVIRNLGAKDWRKPI